MQRQLGDVDAVNDDVPCIGMSQVGHQGVGEIVVLGTSSARDMSPKAGPSVMSGYTPSGGCGYVWGAKHTIYLRTCPPYGRRQERRRTSHCLCAHRSQSEERSKNAGGAFEWPGTSSASLGGRCGTLRHLFLAWPSDQLLIGQSWAWVWACFLQWVQKGLPQGPTSKYRV